MVRASENDMEHYDLVVIGSGPAGEKGAAQAAYFGKRVALVERKPVLGGACVNTGTIPSKTLRESALHLSGFKQRGLYGVDLAMKKHISVADFLFRKKMVVETEWRLIDENLRRHHVTRYNGEARFVSDREIVVDYGDGTEETIGADIFLIATGSSPHRSSAIPFDLPGIYDSDSILELDRMPKSMAVVGAGVIGCEYASIFSALGIEVHLIDGRTALLGHVDREIVGVLLKTFTERLGIELHLGSDVVAFASRGDSIALTLGDGSTIVVDKVLVAAGRQSNTANLGLDAAGVETGKRGLVVVDDTYRTNIPNIYAAGDVIGFPALASTSMEQARVAMVHAFDLKYKTHIASILPYGIYTIPELSMVGMTEEQCQAKSVPYAVGRASFRYNARGQIVGDTEGLIKIVFAPDDLRLLGTHIVGENAAELVHVAVLSMHHGGTINDFIECVFNYPTIGEAYKYAAYDGLGNLADLRKSES